MDAKYIRVRMAGLLEGLLGYWKLDETSGNAVDSHGSYIGTSSNITYTASGKIGRCYTFNGTSSNVNFGDVISPTTAITVTAWIKSSSIPASEGAIVWKSGYSSFWHGFRLTCYSAGNLGVMLSDGYGNDYDNTVATGCLDGNWHLVGFTWDGTTIYGYKDNSRNAGASWAGPIGYISTDLLFGCAIGGSMWWSGEIDEVAIWNIPLTQAQMTDLYNSGNGLTHPFS